MVGNACRPRRRTSIAIGEPPCEKSRRLLTSRGRASCSSTAAATIVGTPRVAVTPSRSTTSSISPGSNDGRMTCLAPTNIVCSTDTEPAAWNNGAMTRYTSSICNGMTICMLMALAIRLRWVRMTPLLAPVVPPV